MSDGLVCDVCGATLLLESDVRYVLEMRGHAAYDPLEITAADLARDHSRDYEDLLGTLASRDAASLEDEIHKSFRADLCPTCWKRFTRDPLAGLRLPGALSGPTPREVGADRTRNHRPKPPSGQ